MAVGALDPKSYDQLLRVDLKRAEASFPDLFAGDAADDWGDEDGWDDGGDDDDGAE